MDEKIEQVNDLLKKAFGRRTKGNLMNFEYTPLPETDHLSMIARGPNWLPSPFYRVIGQFDSQDGSKIRILPRYESQARVYAILYEEKVGIEATLIIDPKANYGPSWC